jgi:hypothetical protein
MPSYLSNDEIKSIQVLHKKAPYLIEGVSRSMFSPVRHYGGCVFYGYDYEYIKETDELIRCDVKRVIDKSRIKTKKAVKIETQSNQEELNLWNTKSD